MNRKEQEIKKLLKYPCPEQDDLGTTGVLLSHEIEHYVTRYKMIDPFEAKNLKPAAYRLTVGDEYSRGGEIGRLIDKPGKNTVDIPPFEVVIVRSKEIINLPRFIIARWDMRVKRAYEGLLWLGGPQVDPGWVGHLSCPIYNLSNKTVKVKLGDPIAVMDFVKTTPFDVAKSQPYQRPPKRVTFDDYEPETLKSALYTEARERINTIANQLNTRVNDIDNKVNRFGTRLDTSLGIIFAAIAVLVTALSIFVSSTRPIEFTLPGWFYLSIGLSAGALTLSIYSLAKGRSRKKDDPNGKSNKL